MFRKLGVRSTAISRQVDMIRSKYMDVGYEQSNCFVLNLSFKE